MTASAEPAPPAPAPRPRRRLSRGKKVLFGLIAVGVPLLVGEVFFQIREVVRRPKPWTSPRVPDTFRGMVLLPNYRIDEPNRTIHINSLGMRAPEPELPKPAGRLRILCVGGSSTYGLFTSRNEGTWPALTEKLLHEAGRTDVEVLDGGAPAWDARVSLTNLELRLFELRPDVVVVCHVYNDAVANLDPQYIHDSQCESVWQLWHPAMGSALLRFAISRVHDPKAMLEHKADAWRPEGVEAYRRNLERLIRRCREEGAQVVLCTEPTCYRPTLEESRRDGVPGLEYWYADLSPFTYPALLGALERYCEEVRRTAADEHVPLIDLARLMPHDVELYNSPVHHSDRGEHVVAGLVSQALLQSGVLERRP